MSIPEFWYAVSVFRGRLVAHKCRVASGYPAAAPDGIGGSRGFLSGPDPNRVSVSVSEPSVSSTTNECPDQQEQQAKAQRPQRPQPLGLERDDRRENDEDRTLSEKHGGQHPLAVRWPLPSTDSS